MLLMFVRLASFGFWSPIKELIHLKIEQRLGPLSDWYGYDPDGFEYLLHTPNICAALFKIGDVFHAYANARAALIFSDQ